MPPPARWMAAAAMPRLLPLLQSAVSAATQPLARVTGTWEVAVRASTAERLTEAVVWDTAVKRTGAAAAPAEIAAEVVAATLQAQLRACRWETAAML